MGKATTIDLAGVVVPLNEKIVYQSPETEIILPGSIQRIENALYTWVKEVNEARYKAWEPLYTEWMKQRGKNRAFDEKQPEMVYLGHIASEEIEWVWEVKTGKNRGLLPRRISKFFYDKYKVKMPASVVEKVGVIASDNRQKSSEKYVFQFTDTLVWERGDFGDDGSCWFSNCSMARPYLRGADGVAVQFFDPDTDAPMARCWLVPAFPLKDTFVIFNGYGNGAFRGQPLNTMSTVLAAYFNLSKIRGHVHNGNVNTKSVFYLNGDSYIFASAKTMQLINPETMYNLNIEKVFTCHNCGVKILDATEAHRDNNYIAYCENCKEHKNTVAIEKSTKLRCSNCHKVVDNEDELTNDPDGDDLCEECFGNMWQTCEHCDEYFPSDDGHTVRVRIRGYSRWSTETTLSEQTWCDNCAESYAMECSACYDLYEEGELVSTRYNHYCSTCAPDNVSVCDQCEESVESDDVVWVESVEETMCKDCHEEWLRDQEDEVRTKELEPQRAEALKKAQDLTLPLFSEEVEKDTDYGIPF